MNNSDIYIIPILDKFLVYSPLRKLSSLVNANVVKELKSYTANKDNAKANKSLSDFFKAFSSPVNEKIKNKKGNLDPMFLGIVPGRQCNMSCAYCNFGVKKNITSKMKPETAVSAIDFIAELSLKNSKDNYNVEFFGGEPFVYQDILDVAIHHALLVGAKTGVLPEFGVLTNGLLTKQQAVFAGNYFDRIVISIDGFREMHNKIRYINKNSGSFDRVAENLNYLKETQAKICLRCCVTNENVDRLSEIASFFCNEFQTSVINFETLSENAETIGAGIKPPDPYKFAKQFILAQQLIQKHGSQLVNASILANEPQNSFCPLGNDTIIAMPDGLLASCYLLPEEWQAKNLDFTVGKIENGNVHINNENIQHLRKMVASKPRCNSCLGRYSCAGGCYISNYNIGKTKEYNNFCIHTRIIKVCNILMDMGKADLVNELLANSEALKAISENMSDKIPDFHFKK